MKKNIWFMCFTVTILAISGCGGSSKDSPTNSAPLADAGLNQSVSICGGAMVCGANT